MVIKMMTSILANKKPRKAKKNKTVYLDWMRICIIYTPVVIPPVVAKRKIRRVITRRGLVRKKLNLKGKLLSPITSEMSIHGSLSDRFSIADVLSSGSISVPIEEDISIVGTLHYTLNLNVSILGALSTKVKRIYDINRKKGYKLVLELLEDE